MTPLLLIPAVIVTGFSLFTSLMLHKSNRELLQLNATLQKTLASYRNIKRLKHDANCQVWAQMEGGRYGRG